MKRPLYMIWLVGLISVGQGCTSVVRHNVTITLKNGQRVTLYFEHLDVHYDHTKPFRELLEKLEAGEEVDVNKPLEEEHPSTPLMYAITYALGRKDYDPDPHFYAAQYLLEHGADPNLLSSPHYNGFQETATHDLCDSLGRKRAFDIRGLALFLSYGARMGIKDTGGRTAINYLEKYEPWISEELREKYEEKPDPSQERKSKPLHKEEKPPAPPAWKSAISQERQKELKKAYFTDIAEALRKLPQYRDAVDKAFLNYIKEAGVDDELVSALSAKTVL